MTSEWRLELEPRISILVSIVSPIHFLFNSLRKTENMVWLMIRRKNKTWNYWDPQVLRITHWLIGSHCGQQPEEFSCLHLIPFEQNKFFPISVFFFFYAPYHLNLLPLATKKIRLFIYVTDISWVPYLCQTLFWMLGNVSVYKMKQECFPS